MPSCQSGDAVRQQFVSYLQQYCTSKDEALRDEAYRHLVVLLGNGVRDRLSSLPEPTRDDAMALAEDILGEYTTDGSLRSLWEKRGRNADPSWLVEEVSRRTRFSVHLQKYVDGNQESLQDVYQVLHEMVEEKLSDLPRQPDARLIEEILPKCATDEALHKLRKKQGERANPSRLIETIEVRVRFVVYVEDWVNNGNKCSREKAFDILYDVARRIASASSSQEAEDLPGQVVIQIGEQGIQRAWEKHQQLIDPWALVNKARNNQLWRNNEPERYMDGLIKEFRKSTDAVETPFAQIVVHILTSAGVTDDIVLDEVIKQLHDRLREIYGGEGAKKGRTAQQAIVNVLSRTLQPYGKAFQWKDFKEVASEFGCVPSFTPLEGSNTDEDGNTTELQIVDQSVEWQPQDYVMRKHAFDPLRGVLSEREFQVMVAGFCRGCTDEEIAELLNTTKEAARQCRSRAIRKLRARSRKLSKQLGIPPEECIGRLLEGDLYIMEHIPYRKPKRKTHEEQGL